ncbi:hypothetical protein U1Q18_048325 [Sarracenia purpurea var. burkii]
MVPPCPDGDGLSTAGNPTPTDKGFVIEAEGALSRSILGTSHVSSVEVDNSVVRLEVGKGKGDQPSPPIGVSAEEASSDTMGSPKSGKKSPTKISDIFTEALSIEGVQKCRWRR